MLLSAASLLTGRQQPNMSTTFMGRSKPLDDLWRQTPKSAEPERHPGAIYTWLKCYNLSSVGESPAVASGLIFFIKRLIWHIFYLFLLCIKYLFMTFVNNLILFLWTFSTQCLNLYGYQDGSSVTRRKTNLITVDSLLPPARACRCSRAPDAGSRWASCNAPSEDLYLHTH